MRLMQIASVFYRQYVSNYTSQTLTEKARLGELIKSLNYNHRGKLLNPGYILLCDIYISSFREAFVNQRCSHIFTYATSTLPITIF